MKRHLPLSFAVLGLCFLFSLSFSIITALRPAWAQGKQPPVPERARLIAAARELMQAQTYCAPDSSSP